MALNIATRCNEMEMKFDSKGMLLWPGRREVLDNGDVVFTCEHNDQEYRDVCTDDAHGTNLAAARPWCTNATTDCRAYSEGGLSDDDFPCFESIAFKCWLFGIRISKIRRVYGRPMTLRNARTGGIAFLTSRSPTVGEEERQIVGFLHVKEVMEGPVPLTRDGEEGQWEVLVGEPSTSLCLSPAARIPFWEVYRGDGSPVRTPWGRGSFTYLEPDVTTTILSALRDACVAIEDVDAVSVIDDHLGKSRTG